MVSVYRLNQKNGSRNDQLACITNNYMAMGWDVPVTPINFAHYAAQARAIYQGKEFPVHTLYALSIGDLILLRDGYLQSTEFFMGVVVDGWFYDHRFADLENRRRCLWLHLGGYSMVPKEFGTLFTPPTLVRVLDHTITEFTLAKARSIGLPI